MSILSFTGETINSDKCGDIIELDVEGRELNVLISDEEMTNRQASWRPKIKKFPRGYGQLFSQHVQQAHEGCDFGFLSGNETIDEPEIH